MRIRTASLVALVVAAIIAALVIIVAPTDATSSATPVTATPAPTPTIVRGDIRYSRGVDDVGNWRLREARIFLPPL